jgi:hypothetical protein
MNDLAVFDGREQEPEAQVSKKNEWGTRFSLVNEKGKNPLVKEHGCATACFPDFLSAFCFLLYVLVIY